MKRSITSYLQWTSTVAFSKATRAAIHAEPAKTLWTWINQPLSPRVDTDADMLLRLPPPQVHPPCLCICIWRVSFFKSKIQIGERDNFKCNLKDFSIISHFTFGHVYTFTISSLSEGKRWIWSLQNIMNWNRWRHAHASNFSGWSEEKKSNVEGETYESQGREGGREERKLRQFTKNDGIPSDDVAPWVSKEVRRKREIFYETKIKWA